MLLRSLHYIWISHSLLHVLGLILLFSSSYDIAVTVAVFKNNELAMRLLLTRNNAFNYAIKATISNRLIEISHSDLSIGSISVCLPRFKSLIVLVFNLVYFLLLLLDYIRKLDL